MSLMLPHPTIEQVKFYLDKRESLENYVAQENALNKLFSTLPFNTDLDDVLLKSATLNHFYSTNIFSIYSVAKHILSLKNVDKRLQAGDLSLIDEIRKITINEKNKDSYSFASKYCAHHNGDAFPIFDSYVEKVLWYFQQTDKFSQFKWAELKNYATFKQVLLDFKAYYRLDCTLRELDTYLWLLGKDFFRKNKDNKNQ